MSVAQIPSSPELLLVAGEFPATPPQDLFAYWTQPELLCLWWPLEAEVEPREGGSYRLSWPTQGWNLRGRYTVFEPGERLGFTWRWDHDAEGAGERQVMVIFGPLTTGGTRLRLTHGTYVDTPDDQELRIESHLVGWLHFLGRLQQTVGAPGIGQQ